MKIKYNEKISDFNSDIQRSKDIQRVGNVIFNKGGSNKEDKAAWLRLKEYLNRLENFKGV